MSFTFKMIIYMFKIYIMYSAVKNDDNWTSTGYVLVTTAL